MTSPACKVDRFVETALGRPYRRGAHGPDEFDCYGLCRAFYKEVFGFDVPIVTPDSYLTFGKPDRITRFSWRRAPDPPLGALVAMARGRIVSHIGVFVGPHILHASAKHGVVMQCPQVIRSQAYKHITYYQHDSLSDKD